MKNNLEHHYKINLLRIAMITLCCCGFLTSHGTQGEELSGVLRIEVIGQSNHNDDSVNTFLPISFISNKPNMDIDSLASLVSNSASVNLNGQGGLFQSVNIRGLARWRISTSIEGVPIHTERRAGTAAEFLSPSMVDEVQVLKGAASTQLGSGALGGGINFKLNTPGQDRLRLLYGSNNDYLEWHSEHHFIQQNLQFMLNHRRANDSSDGAGNVIKDKFENTSFSMRLQPLSDVFRDNIFLYSRSNNVAKADAFPRSERVTEYPKNEHLFIKSTLNWYDTTIYIHKTNLDTVVVRPEQRINSLSSNATNVGFKLHNDFEYSNWSFQWQAGTDARFNVRISEEEMTNLGGVTFENDNLDAEQWEVFSSVGASTFFDENRFGGGVRLSNITQNSDLDDVSISDFNMSAFLGYVIRLSSQWGLHTYFSSAYRTPSLTERFYEGTTPRGRVLGSSSLQAENAFNSEISMRYHQSDTRLNISIFKQHIEDYIERITLSDSLRQYQNLDSADILGVNYEFNRTFKLNHFDIELNLSGQWLDGEDNFGNPISDIVPANHRLSLEFNTSGSSAFFNYTHRQSSDESVVGENATDSANVIDLGYQREIGQNWTVIARLNNVMDELLVTSKDEYAPFARGRELILSIEYRIK